MPKAKPKWKLIEDCPISEYQCGVRAGERVKLRLGIIVRDNKGKPTGQVHHAGEIWKVLTGAAEPPVAVWLRQPNGQQHTWNDDAGFWDWFERTSEHAA